MGVQFLELGDFNINFDDDDSPPLHALKSGQAGGDGVYAYGATSQFPNASFRSSNYWVDVLYAVPAPGQVIGEATRTMGVHQSGRDVRAKRACAAAKASRGAAGRQCHKSARS